MKKVIFALMIALSCAAAAQPPGPTGNVKDVAVVGWSPTGWAYLNSTTVTLAQLGPAAPKVEEKEIH